MANTLDGGPAKAESPLHRLGATVENDSSGIVGMLVLMGTAVAGSYLLWSIFAQPLAVVGDILPTKTCTGQVAGTSGMRWCGAQAGLVKMIGPIAMGVGIFFARKPLTRWTQMLAQKLPSGLRPLVAPLLAVTLFMLIWAGTHKDSSEQVGLLPQKAFPMLLGVYTYAVMRYGQTLQARMSGFLDLRDRMAFIVRVFITIGVPTLVSVLITNQDRVSDSALKEQVVVVIGLGLAYLLLVPRGEHVASVTHRLLGQERS